MPRDCPGRGPFGHLMAPRRCQTPSVLPACFPFPSGSGPELGGHDGGRTETAEGPPTSNEPVSTRRESVDAESRAVAQPSPSRDDRPLVTAPSSTVPLTRREQLARAAERLAKQRHLVAVRDGIVGALPLVLVGSLFLLIAQPPFPALQRLIAPYSATFLLPYRALGGCIALWVTFGTAHALARSYALDASAAGLIATSAYVLAALQPGAPPQTLGLLLGRLGAGGIFAGLLLAIATVELTRALVARRWTLRIPGGAPDVVVRSFVALLPATLVLSGVFVLVHLLGF